MRAPRLWRLAPVLVLAAGWAGARTLPDFAAVRAQYRSSETLVLSREGEVLERLRTDPTVRRGAWQALDEVSAALRHEKAMIGLVLDSADAHEGCKAFLEKRDAVFTGE